MDIETVIRFHDIRQLDRLNDCLFSVCCQSSPPKRVHIIAQDFNKSEQELLSQSAGCFSLPINIHNIERSHFRNLRDLRVPMLNHGISVVQADLVHILDFDDLIYQDAYSKFIAIAESSPAVSFFYFQRVERTFSIVCESFDYCCMTDRPYAGNSELDLLQDNFCPIHSYVTNLGLARRLGVSVYFDERYEVLEDYDFLLRYSRYGCNFSGINNVIGMYNFRDDGTNTSITNGDDPNSSLTISKNAVWDRGRKLIAECKASLKGFNSDILPTSFPPK